MVKAILMFSLREGVDQEQFWQYWKDKHSIEYKKRPGLKKYIINRVTKVRGDINISGVSEIWFENNEAYIQANDPKYNKYSKDDHFWSQIKDAFRLMVDEEVIL